MLLEGCPLDVFRTRDILINDLTRRIDLGDNPNIIPVIGCAEINYSSDSSTESSHTIMLVVLKPLSDVFWAPLLNPSFKDLEPVKRLSIYLGIAKTVASVHTANLIYGAIDAEAFDEIDFETSQVKLRNFQLSGTFGMN